MAPVTIVHPHGAKVYINDLSLAREYIARLDGGDRHTPHPGPAYFSIATPRHSRRVHGQEPPEVSYPGSDARDLPASPHGEGPSVASYQGEAQGLPTPCQRDCSPRVDPQEDREGVPREDVTCTSKSLQNLHDPCFEERVLFLIWWSARVCPQEVCDVVPSVSSPEVHEECERDPKPRAMPVAPFAEK